MHLIKVLAIFISCVFAFCNTQTYSQAPYQYPAQRRAGYSYTPSSYYNRPNAYSASSATTSASAGSYYQKPKTHYSSSGSSAGYPTKSYYQSSSANRYPDQSSGTSNRGYSSSSDSTKRYPAQSSSSLNRGYSSSYDSTKRYPAQSSSTLNRGYSSSSDSTKRYPAQSSSSLNRGYSSLSDSTNRYSAKSSSTAGRGSSSSPYSSDTSVGATSPHASKDYLTNSYIGKDNAATSNQILPPQDNRKGKYRPSKADVENAKFAGADNQEDTEDESGRTAHLKRRKFLRRRLAAAYNGGNRCFPYGRDAAGGKSATPPPKEQGRFLFDLNVYNVYPQTAVGIGNSGVGCGGFGGGFGGGGILGDAFGYGGGPGGLLADPIGAPLYPGQGLNQFLSQWAPGILQNSLAVTARPLADPTPASDQDNDLQSDPDVDPNYRPIPVRRPRPPNRVYYDSAGAAPITPGQLVGGVATTINGIIQQLTGNVQPVYQSYRRSASYG